MRRARTSCDALPHSTQHSTQHSAKAAPHSVNPRVAARRGQETPDTVVGMPVPVERTHSRTAPAGVVLAILAIVAVIGLGAYLHFVESGPIAFDRAWQQAAALQPGTTGFTVAAFLAEIGSGIGVAACGAIACALLLTRQFSREAAALATGLLLGVALSEILKNLVARPRPLGALYPWEGYSYPSGHSMGAAALALGAVYAIASIRRRGATVITQRSITLLWIAAICWILAMMWSRTALGVHWASDTIAGALTGTAAVVLAQAFWEARARRHARQQSS